MPRTLTTAMQTALSASVLRCALLVSLQFADNTIYVWSGIGPMTWNGNTYQGVGSLGSISTISEDSTVEAKSVTFELSGIPSSLVSEVLWETRLLYTAQAYFALWDANGNLIDTPVLSYQGKMDQPTIEDNGQTCTISISTENVLVDLNRACYRRYTNDDQQIDLPEQLKKINSDSDTTTIATDTGFRWVAGLQEQITFWGSKPSSINNV
jgi:hypothetical protein